MKISVAVLYTHEAVLLHLWPFVPTTGLNESIFAKLIYTKKLYNNLLLTLHNYSLSSVLGRDRVISDPEDKAGIIS